MLLILYFKNEKGWGETVSQENSWDCCRQGGSALLFDPQVVDMFFKIEKERPKLDTGEIKS